MNLAGWIFKKAGWRYEQNTTLPDKCVIVIAPHTSNWDFILGELATRSVGIKASFLMKSTWFFFPLGPLMRRLGGIPVDRKRHGNVTASVVEAFNSRQRLAVGVTPEGTRSANPVWHKGALHIAHEAGVPLILAYIDYGTRTVCIDRALELTDDVDGDMVRMKQYYSRITARYPEKFVTGLE